MPENDVKSEGQQSGTGAAQPDSDKQLPFNEHPRWKEVYGELQEFKKYGKPTDLERLSREHREMTAIIQEAQRLQAEAVKAPMAPDEKANAVQLEAARKELLKLVPELAALPTLQAAQEAHWSRLERAAISETKKIMGDSGFETTDGEVQGMSDILADIIKNDADLWAEYEANPRGAVRDAYKKFESRFKPKAEREAAAQKQRDREPLKALPKAHGAGGAGDSGEKPSEPPKTLKEAEARAVQRLRGMEL